jgi:hypothetical protein
MKNSSSPSTKRNMIMRAYLFFFIGVGILMMSIGFFNISQNIYKRVLLPKYPMNRGYESRCDYLMGAPVLFGPEGGREITESDKEAQAQNEKRTKDCEMKLEEERQVRKVTDLFNGLIIFFIGFMIFSGHLIVNIKTNPKK